MIGRTISHYRIIEKIGSGGMGVVYKAEDTKLHRTVALKFLPVDLTTDKETKQRFINEAQAASSLQHNNVCTIHDIDETDDGRLFICMDCYEGITLKEKIANGEPCLPTGRLRIEEVIDIATQIAEGLGKAHENGIIHRDIKPANIFITKDGVVKILDFGLAKLIHIAQVTQLGVKSGTAAYMSPEQARGETVDLRTDIWSLGVVIYEMLTGELPFKAEYEQAVVYMILNQEPEDIFKLHSEIPEFLGFLAHKCLMKEADQRPRSMGEIISILMKESKIELKIPHRRKLISAKQLIGLILIIIIVALSGWLIVNSLHNSKKEPPDQIVIGSLPFRNLVKDEKTDSWPLLVQQLIDQMLVVSSDEIRIVYHEFINGVIKDKAGEVKPFKQVCSLLQDEEINIIVDGKISKSNGRYRIDMNLIDPTIVKTIQSFPEEFTDESNLYSAVGNLVKKINNFLYVERIHPDKELKNWQKNTSINYEALKKFQFAKDQIFHNVKAEANLREAIKLDSTFIAPRIWLIPQLITARSKEANVQFRMLQKLYPSASPFEQAMINWVDASMKKDINAQARYLRNALEYSPRDFILLHNLALVQMSLCLYEEAIETVKPCVQNRWEYLPVYEVAALACIKIGKIKEAKVILEESLSLPTYYEKNYLLLAIIYLKDNEIEKSRKYEKLSFERFTEKKIAVDRIYRLSSDYCQNLGLYDMALEKIGEAIKIDPSNSAYRTRKAEILFLKSEYAKSKSECVLALNSKAPNPRAFFIMGRLYDKDGNKLLADKNYKKFYQLDSSNCDAIELKSRIKTKLKS